MSYFMCFTCILIPNPVVWVTILMPWNLSCNTCKSIKKTLSELMEAWSLTDILACSLWQHLGDQHPISCRVPSPHRSGGLTLYIQPIGKLESTQAFQGQQMSTDLLTDKQSPSWTSVKTELHPVTNGSLVENKRILSKICGIEESSLTWLQNWIHSSWIHIEAPHSLSTIPQYNIKYNTSDKK